MQLSKSALFSVFGAQCFVGVYIVHFSTELNQKIMLFDRTMVEPWKKLSFSLKKEKKKRLITI